MLRFYEKAFATDDPSVLQLRRRAYGNFHRVLAGSYFHQGRLDKFFVQTVKSLWSRPAGIRYFLEYPLRRLRKASALSCRVNEQDSLYLLFWDTGAARPNPGLAIPARDQSWRGLCFTSYF